MIGGVVCLKEADRPGQEADRTCEISRLFVHPDCRRLAIASRLLQEAKIEALKIGYKKMEVRFLQTHLED